MVRYETDYKVAVYVTLAVIYIVIDFLKAQVCWVERERGS